MIKGISFEKGVFFIGKRHVSCGYDENGRIVDWVKPLNSKAFLQVLKKVIWTMPCSFKIISFVFLSLIFVPKAFLILGYEILWGGLPFYFLFYFMYGTHFIFPVGLRKFHGAEHKVFSYRGMKTLGNLKDIKQAKITNRYCSTNLVVVYFSSVLLLLTIFIRLYSFPTALAYASYGAFLLAPLVNSQLNRKVMKWVKNYVLTVSFFLQEKLTTTEPDDFHIKTAIRSYRRLALREFPNELRIKRKQKEEEQKMAIVDITIIPIGTEGPSVSNYVAEIHKVLETYQDRVNYKLTPMSTIIEGELSVLFEVIQALHEVPFTKGIKRVATNIRIDDRRDKLATMSEKLSSVEKKLQKESEAKSSE